MNDTLRIIDDRRSIRNFDDRPLSAEVVDAILHATMRSPTAGNMMLYSIINIEDQTLKEKLAVSCDNQPFIAKAPLVWLFVADYQRWVDYFDYSQVSAYCAEQGIDRRHPAAGDLMLAACDALIAAQTAVIAAESLGVGSCYIGDIMENFELHQELLGLPQYVFPITLLTFGYPKQQESAKTRTPRFPKASIYFENRYQRLNGDDFDTMFAGRDVAHYQGNASNFGQHMYARKFASEFSVEMSRSAQLAIDTWLGKVND